MRILDRTLFNLSRLNEFKNKFSKILLEML
jgi:hypothetical protein